MSQPPPCSCNRSCKGTITIINGRIQRKRRETLSHRREKQQPRVEIIKETESEPPQGNREFFKTKQNNTDGQAVATKQKAKRGKIRRHTSIKDQSQQECEIKGNTPTTPALDLNATNSLTLSEASNIPLPPENPHELEPEETPVSKLYIQPRQLSGRMQKSSGEGEAGQEPENPPPPPHNSPKNSQYPQFNLTDGDLHISPISPTTQPDVLPTPTGGREQGETRKPYQGTTPPVQNIKAGLLPTPTGKKVEIRRKSPDPNPAQQQERPLKATRIGQNRSPPLQKTQKGSLGHTDTQASRSTRKVTLRVINTKSTLLVRHLRNAGIKEEEYSNVGLPGGGIAVTFVNEEVYRVAARTLAEHKVENVQFGIPGERSISLVLRGLPPGEEVDELRKELERHVKVVKVQQMNSKRTREPLPLYKVDVANEGDEQHITDKLLNIPQILGFRSLRWEHYTPPTGPLQCYKCQRLGHNSRQCHCEERCVRCGGKHSHKVCTATEPTCALCGGPHSAAANKCPEKQKWTRGRGTATTQPPQTRNTQQPPTQPQPQPRNTQTQRPQTHTQSAAPTINQQMQPRNTQNNTRCNKPSPQTQQITQHIQHTQSIAREHMNKAAHKTYAQAIAGTSNTEKQPSDNQTEHTQTITFYNSNMHHAAAIKNATNSIATQTTPLPPHTAQEIVTFEKFQTLLKDIPFYKYSAPQKLYDETLKLITHLSHTENSLINKQVVAYAYLSKTAQIIQTELQRQTANTTNTTQNR